tara:strand:- start:32054 stop:32653 length:600 start_codon:yes stop_codon:yes gene_type:complete
MNHPHWLQATELIHDDVLLRPLRVSDADALVAAATDGRLWELWYTQVPSASSVADYVNEALAEQQAGRALPFAVIDRESGAVIGSTRFCNAEPSHLRLEIGYTWYAARYQRTALNTRCKLLLLEYAFDTLGAVAVEFRTHWHNQRSRQAIARLGAKQDGVLRNHRIEADGAHRDTVVFSILDSEWPVVAKSLRFRLQRA